MRTIHIATHLEDKKSPSELLSFGQRLSVSHAGNALYPVTNPSLTIFNTDLTTLADAITAWGSRVNHGTTQNHQNLIDAAKAVRTDIVALKTSDENTTPGIGADFLSGGWEITEADEGRVGVFAAPTGLHILFENHVVIPGRIHYGWNPVHGASGYRVWTGTGALPATPPDATLPYQTVTHGHFDDYATSGLSRWIVVGCVGTNPATGYATLSGNIVP